MPHIPATWNSRLAGAKAQELVEWLKWCLPSECKALNSNPSTTPPPHALRKKIKTLSQPNKIYVQIKCRPSRNLDYQGIFPPKVMKSITDHAVTPREICNVVY
jgi:hypothetical protein